MAENFVLEIDYNGKRQSFEGELSMLGYTHKIFMQVNGIEVVFEPDEERNYRAVIPGEQYAGKMDKDLLQAIVRELENALK